MRINGIECQKQILVEQKLGGRPKSGQPLIISKVSSISSHNPHSTKKIIVLAMNSFNELASIGSRVFFVFGLN